MIKKLMSKLNRLCQSDPPASISYPESRITSQTCAKHVPFKKERASWRLSSKPMTNWIGKSQFDKQPAKKITTKKH